MKPTHALPLLALGALACGSSPPPSDHPQQDDAAQASGQGVAPPRAQLAFLEVIEGPLSEEGARASLGPMRPRVQACLAASSIRVEGHLVARLEVEPDGTIARSGTDHVDGLDPELVFCLVRAIRGCRMPRAEAPSVVRVGLDFNDPRGVESTTAQPEAELSDAPVEPEPASGDGEGEPATEPEPSPDNETAPDA